MKGSVHLFVFVNDYHVATLTWFCIPFLLELGPTDEGCVNPYRLGFICRIRSPS